MILFDSENPPNVSATNLGTDSERLVLKSCHQRCSRHMVREEWWGGKEEGVATLLTQTKDSTTDIWWTDLVIDKPDLSIWARLGGRQLYANAYVSIPKRPLRGRGRHILMLRTRCRHHFGPKSCRSRLLGDDIVSICLRGSAEWAEPS